MPTLCAEKRSARIPNPSRPAKLNANSRLPTAAAACGIHQTHRQAPAACEPSSLQHLVREITHRRKSRAKYEANRVELPERLHLSEQQTCGSNKSRTDR